MYIGKKWVSWALWVSHCNCNSEKNDGAHNQWHIKMQRNKEIISIHHKFVKNKEVKAMYITSENFFKTPHASR